MNSQAFLIGRVYCNAQAVLCPDSLSSVIAGEAPHAWMHTSQTSCAPPKVKADTNPLKRKNDNVVT